MASQPSPQLTAAEYLAIERDVEDRHEFYRGDMFAMGGASRTHNRITINLVASIHGQLRDRDCEVFANDMRVKVDPTGLYTYPDAVITCNKPQFEDEHVDTLLNPQVLIEVLWETTEKYDRGKKFEHYRQIESLREYILVSQDHPQIERFDRREDGRWELDEARGLDAVLELPAVDCQLHLSDVYAKVDFPKVN